MLKKRTLTAVIFDMGGVVTGRNFEQGSLLCP